VDRKAFKSPAQVRKSGQLFENYTTVALLLLQHPAE
jgi:hypothetical protein